MKGEQKYMKEITIDQLVDLIKWSIENGINTYIRLYEYNGTICVEAGKNYIIEQLPEEGKYDYIFEKLKESFENELVSQHDLGGFYGGLMFIEAECIEFDYKSSRGQNWLYENF